MKKIVMIYGLMMILTACSDWLDVNPRTEMKEEQLFKTEDGFKSALVGAYIQMASQNLYGKNVTMYFPELLAQTWLAASNQDENPLETYVPQWDFKQADVESLIETIYKSYYKCIAHLNEVLVNMDMREGVFMNGNYALIKGEALGLRAFLHLDLLRLFGPVPGSRVGSLPAIPYVEEITKDPGRLQTLSYDEVVKRIIRDLDAAEKLLENDPLVHGENKYLNSLGLTPPEGVVVPVDEWQFCRQVRFNYYAVKAAKARYYQWIGDGTNALKYAREVIDSKKFRLTNETDYQRVDDADYESSLVMLSEHIFGVDNPSLQDVVTSLFKSKTVLLTQTNKNIQTAFEGITGDIRNVTNRYWMLEANATGQIVNQFQKYSGNDMIKGKTKVPLLRLAEMYLIAFEYLPAGEREVYYKEYLIARNLPLDWEANLKDELPERLEKEYRKEFMGEGQMFFFYKRLNYAEFRWPSIFKVPATGYAVPLPHSQTVFD